MQRYIFLIVFITGAAVLIIEVTAIRILAPYFGNTLFSVSSVIGVTLGALSLGYYLGGLLADKKANFLIFFFLIFMAGFFSLLIQFFAQTILPFWGYFLNVKIGSVLMSIILFFAPILILGMISPLAIKLSTDNIENIGQVTGKIFFYSTLGSIGGSFLTGFLLIPNFGVSKIIVFTGSLLMIIGFLGILVNERRFYFKNGNLLLGIAIVFLISFLILIISSKSRSLKDIIFEKDGIYNKIMIRETKMMGERVRVLHFDRSQQAAVSLDSDNLLFDYTKYYEVYKIFNPDASRFLFIGGGAYSMPRKLLLEEKKISKIDVVEIEPSLYQLAKQYFRLPTSSLLINHITDGRRFLVETKEKYDFIFADAYYSIYSIPFHLTTKEFFLLAKDRLSERGVFAMNVIGRLEGKGSQFLLSEIKTFSSVFKNSYFIAVESLDKKTVQNFIFIGLKDEAPKINFKDEKFLTSKKEIVSKLTPKIIDLRKLNLDSVFVLTDDFAPVEYLIADLLEV